MKKMVFCNWPYNSLYLYAMSDNEQGMSCIIATHCIYNATHCHSIVTLSKQFIFNYYATPL